MVKIRIARPKSPIRLYIIYKTFAIGRTITILISSKRFPCVKIMPIRIAARIKYLIDFFIPIYYITIGRKTLEGGLLCFRFL